MIALRRHSSDRQCFRVLGASLEAPPALIALEQVVLNLENSIDTNRGWSHDIRSVSLMFTRYPSSYHTARIEVFALVRSRDYCPLQDLTIL